MAEETNETVETVEETTEETTEETVDWKAKVEELETKLKETGIKNRERTKALKEQITEKPETSKETKPDDKLLEKIDRLTLQAGGIKEKEEVELAEKWKESTGRELDEVLRNEIFQKELQVIRDDRANELATTDVKGSGSPSEAKLKPEFWIAKGNPPTAEDIPDRKVRMKIIRAMMKNSSTSGKTFYND